MRLKASDTMVVGPNGEVADDSTVETASDHSEYETDEWRMNNMKVLPCAKRFCHEWTTCPFAHPHEKARRRDPRLFTYTGIACPAMKKDGACTRGDSCPYAHNTFEYWLHPTRYRTQLCNDGSGCKRRVCFFAHAPDQLRSPASKPYVPPEALAAANACVTADAQLVEAAAASKLAVAQRGTSDMMMHTAQGSNATSIAARLVATSAGMQRAASVMLPPPPPPPNPPTYGHQVLTSDTMYEEQSRCDEDLLAAMQQLLDAGGDPAAVAAAGASAAAASYNDRRRRHAAAMLRSFSEGGCSSPQQYLRRAGGDGGGPTAGRSPLGFGLQQQQQPPPPPRSSSPVPHSAYLPRDGLDMQQLQQSLETDATGPAMDQRQALLEHLLATSGASGSGVIAPPPHFLPERDHDGAPHASALQLVPPHHQQQVAPPPTCNPFAAAAQHLSFGLPASAALANGGGGASHTSPPPRSHSVGGGNNVFSQSSAYHHHQQQQQQQQSSGANQDFPCAAFNGGGDLRMLSESELSDISAISPAMARNLYKTHSSHSAYSRLSLDSPYGSMPGVAGGVLGCASPHGAVMSQQQHQRMSLDMLGSSARSSFDHQQLPRPSFDQQQLPRNSFDQQQLPPMAAGGAGGAGRNMSFHADDFRNSSLVMPTMHEEVEGADGNMGWMMHGSAAAAAAACGVPPGLDASYGASSSTQMLGQSSLPQDLLWN